jgi:hypothetical protein
MKFLLKQPVKLIRLVKFQISHIRLVLPAILIISLLSCEEIIEEPNISEETVFILAPLEGSSIGSNTISFNWEEVLDSRAYTVQVASPDFTNAVQLALDSTLVRDTLGFLPTKVQTLLSNGNYQWRVRAENASFETPYTTASFVVNGDEDIDLLAPNTPVLLSPANNSSQDETDVGFSWSREDIPGTAESDSIYIYTDQALQTLESKDRGANKAYNTNLGANTYYWRVRAFDTAGNLSDFSETFELTIN